jgi:hypothetical protein
MSRRPGEHPMTSGTRQNPPCSEGSPSGRALRTSSHCRASNPGGSAARAVAARHTTRGSAAPGGCSQDDHPPARGRRVARRVARRGGRRTRGLHHSDDLRARAARRFDEASASTFAHGLLTEALALELAAGERARRDGAQALEELDAYIADARSARGRARAAGTRQRSPARGRPGDLGAADTDRRPNAAQCPSEHSSSADLAGKARGRLRLLSVSADLRVPRDRGREAAL